MFGVADNTFYDIGLKYIVLIKFQIACFLAFLTGTRTQLDISRPEDSPNSHDIFRDH